MNGVNGAQMKCLCSIRWTPAITWLRRYRFRRRSRLSPLTILRPREVGHRSPVFQWFPSQFISFFLLKVSRATAYKRVLIMSELFASLQGSDPALGCQGLAVAGPPSRWEGVLLEVIDRGGAGA